MTQEKPDNRREEGQERLEDKGVEYPDGSIVHYVTERFVAIDSRLLGLRAQSRDCRGRWRVDPPFGYDCRGDDSDERKQRNCQIECHPLQGS